MDWNRSLMVVMGIELKMADTKPIAEAPTGLATNDKGDFYQGKWDLTFIGTPGGDLKMIAHLSRKNGKLTGNLIDLSGKNPPTRLRISLNLAISWRFSSPPRGLMSTLPLHGRSEHYEGQDDGHV